MTSLSYGSLFQVLNPIRPGGGESFWCPHQLWIACNFRQYKIILSYHRTFPQIYLAVWWCGRVLVMGSDVAMATVIWRACLAEIWISCLFFTLNWIEIWSLWTLLFWEKCYLRFFQSICDVTDDVIQIYVQIVKSGNDVIIVYFWLSEFFLFRFYAYLVYFRPYLTEIV